MPDFHHPRMALHTQTGGQRFTLFIPSNMCLVCGIWDLKHFFPANDSSVPLVSWGCQPLSSPGILQTGQTCGCCFARSFSVFGCRLYAEHRQLACSHTRAQSWRCSTPYSALPTLVGKSWWAMYGRIFFFFFKGVVKGAVQRITEISNSNVCGYADT